MQTEFGRNNAWIRSLKIFFYRELAKVFIEEANLFGKLSAFFILFCFEYWESRISIFGSTNDSISKLFFGYSVVKYHQKREKR
jgi:hypothetical protein